MKKYVITIIVMFIVVGALSVGLYLTIGANIENLISALVGFLFTQWAFNETKKAM